VEGKALAPLRRRMDPLRAYLGRKLIASVVMMPWHLISRTEYDIMPSKSVRGLAVSAGRLSGSVRRAVMNGILFDAVGFAVILCPLVAICALHWRKPRLFSSFGRCALWALGLSLWSWILFAGMMLIECHLLDDWPDNGFAVACALYLGWLYIWPFAIVVGLVYLVVRLLFRRRVQS